MIKANELGEVISAEIQKLAEETAEHLEEVATQVGKEAVAELKKTSPRRTHNGKHYANGWKSKKQKTKLGTVQVTVYNSTKPHLTHVLEHGHVARNGKRVNGIPHIKPVRDEIEKKLKERL